MFHCKQKVYSIHVTINYNNTISTNYITSKQSRRKVYNIHVTFSYYNSTSTYYGEYQNKNGPKTPDFVTCCACYYPVISCICMQVCNAHACKVVSELAITSQCRNSPRQGYLDYIAYLTSLPLVSIRRHGETRWYCSRNKISLRMKLCSSCAHHSTNLSVSMCK